MGEQFEYELKMFEKISTLKYEEIFRMFKIFKVFF